MALFALRRSTPQVVVMPASKSGVRAMGIVPFDPAPPPAQPGQETVDQAAPVSDTVAAASDAPSVAATFGWTVLSFIAAAIGAALAVYLNETY